jgi:hypothetical protein
MLRARCLAIASAVALSIPVVAKSQVTGAGPDSVPPSITLPSELARVLTDYENAYPKGGAAVSELFLEDGYVLPSGRPAVKGRAAIAAYYGNGGPLALRAFAYATEGNVGYILGAYTSRRGNPDSGKFTLTLRRVGGRWMIVSDMDNMNSRPQRGPAPPPQ